jgi:hypothetical protein
MLCPLLLDRRTSVCLQKILPVPLTPLAPLPVPMRPYLGRPLRMLRTPRCSRSTFLLHCGCQDHLLPRHARPPRVLPRHERPWSCLTPYVMARLPLHRPRALQHPSRRPAGHHPDSLLSGRLATSRTSTSVDHVSRWRPPRPLLLHRSPPPSAASLPKGAIAVPPVTNQHSMGTRSKSGYRMPSIYHAMPLSPVPKTFRSTLADPNWRAAMEEEHNVFFRITPGILCLALLGPMLSLGSGSLSTSFSLMAPSSGTRRVGFSVVLPSGLVWTLMRLSVLW